MFLKGDKYGKTFLCVSIILLMVFITLFSTFFIAGSAIGKEDSYWSENRDVGLLTSPETIEIETAQQLAQVAYLVNNESVDFNGKTIKLCSGLNLSANYWIPIGTQDHAFKGTFDGNNCTIAGLRINGGYDYCGLIGYTTGEIKNLNLSDVSIDVACKICTAGVCAYTTNKISNCQVSGTINCLAIDRGGVKVGGICGVANTNADISPCIFNCNNLANINMIGKDFEEYLAGICAQISADNKIEACINQGNIETTLTDIHASGICGGENNNITIGNCENRGKISTGGTSSGITNSNGSITNCSNFGEISGRWCAGIAQGVLESISNCYNGAKICSKYGAYGICSSVTTIYNCVNNGNIEVTDNLQSNRAAGIAEHASSISNCNNNKKIECVMGMCAGIVLVADNVNNCYNKGELKQTDGYNDKILGVAGIVYRNSGYFDKDFTISDCYNSGNLHGDSVGGIVYYASQCKNLTITRCVNLAKNMYVDGQFDNAVLLYGCGGIIGATRYVSQTATIEYCANHSEISVGGEGKNIGGIIGAKSEVYQYPMTIRYCYNTGKIGGTKNNKYIGGILGSVTVDADPVDSPPNYAAQLYLFCCYNLGDITGGANIGGIVGFLNNTNQYVLGCFNVGTIWATTDATVGIYVGGIVGRGVYDKPIVEYNMNLGKCNNYIYMHKCIAGTSDGSGIDSGGGFQNNLQASSFDDINNYFKSGGSGYNYLTSTNNLFGTDINGYKFNNASISTLKYIYIPIYQNTTQASCVTMSTNKYNCKKYTKKISTLIQENANMNNEYHLTTFLNEIFGTAGGNTNNIVLKSFYWEYNPIPPPEVQ